jgi:EAL domain-containing protein (putative c-di-GMP-specific phosphodiesterase class I)
MVQAKREGGNRVSLYSGAITKPAPRDAVALEAGLRRALEQNEIEVYYQPVVRLKDGAVAGFEALLRWRHPGRGLIDPEEFVSHAEQTGLIVRLGKLVLERAVSDLKRWQSLSRSEPPIFVSVNVAWRQIADESFAKDLSSLLRQAGLPKNSLKLEITESAVMAGKEKAEAALARLKAVGAGLAIDDFGTGYSALGHLVRFPFDTIKIDKSFVAAASEAPGAAILASIVVLARELALASVAEGVQSHADALRLQAMGCEYGQGYYFGAPLPAADALKCLPANVR